MKQNSLFIRSLYLISVILVLVFMFTVWNNGDWDQMFSHDYLNKIIFESVSLTPENLRYDNFVERSADESVTALIRFNIQGEFDKNNYADNASLRKDVKKFYTSRMGDYIKLPLFKTLPKMSISEYSPYIAYTFENKTSFQKYYSHLCLIAKKPYIAQINVFEDNFVQESANVAGDDANYNMAVALTDIGVTHQYTNGTGAVIGIWEYAGVLELSNQNFTSKSNLIDLEPDAPVFTHATVVSAIAAGVNGVAPGARIIGRSVKDIDYNNEYINDLNYFALNGTNVINISWTIGVKSFYSGLDAYLDCFSKNNNIVIVKSAGNTADYPDSSGRVTMGGNGYNVVTVASSNVERRITSTSSYESFNERKPTIAAPGQRLVIPGLDGNNSVDGNGLTNSGTSFSAPMVTGIIALLWTEYPLFFANNIISALVCGASPLNETIDNFWYLRGGAGLVNYIQTREALQNAGLFSLSSSTSPYQTYSVNLNGSDKIRVSMNCRYNAPEFVFSSESQFHNQYTAAVADYYLQLWKGSQLVATSTNSNSNIEVLEYTVPAGTALATYQIKLKRGESNTTGTDSGSITYRIAAHLHSYVYTNLGENHSALCTTCSHTENQNHTYLYRNKLSATHVKYCKYCSFSITEVHNFVPYGVGRYRCTICDYTKTGSVPQPYGDETLI